MAERDLLVKGLVEGGEQTREEGAMHKHETPNWEVLDEGDVIITNMRDGEGMLAVQVTHGKLQPVRYPFKPDPDHPEPIGTVSDARIPLTTGLWRKVFDGKTGWRRD